MEQLQVEQLQVEQLIQENKEILCICTDSEDIKEILQRGNTSEIVHTILIHGDSIYICDVDEINILKNKVEYITLQGISFQYAFPVEQFIHYNE